MTSTTKGNRELCREGGCPRKASTIIESKLRGHVFKYYICRVHWNRLLKIWLKDKGFKLL